KFVVRQRMHRVYSQIAEELIVDVAVKMLHQLRAAQTCVHLQEHQRNLALRGEVCFSPFLRSHALAYQSKVLCHLTKRQPLPDFSQLASLERPPIQFIKIELRERKIG
ncbi:hypothetical protein HMPREF1033_03170, partial [Tannerella sp. 6_1_58FAA_CT1]